MNASNPVSARVGSNMGPRNVHDYALYGKNFISYENVLKDTDLIYEMQSNCLKEYVLLKSAAAPTEYSFVFEAPDTVASKTENGSIEFIDSNGEVVFALESLFAFDSNGEYSNELNYSINL